MAAKIDVNFERRFFQKTLFFLRKRHVFLGPGGRKIKNKSKKNRSKNEAKMRIALGIDFSWIFFDFGRQVGAKLASKIDKKSIQKSIKNMMRKKRYLDASWRRLGPVLACGGGHAPRARSEEGGFLGPPN